LILIFPMLGKNPARW